MQAIKYKNKKLFYLDQRKLPEQESWRSVDTLKAARQAIKELRVRGAPLIGVFSAYSICVHLDNLSKNKNLFFEQIGEAFDYLKKSRPTAVNLSWALDRLAKVVVSNRSKDIEQIKKRVIQEAKLIHKEDKLICQKIAERGAKLIKKNDRIITHCNTGFLAASGVGTALGVIYQSAKEGKSPTVYVDETRPLLQGSRLTAWELVQKRIKHFLIPDNTAAFLMQKNEVDKILVGADRITSFGDVANKIGTYNLAVLAKQHKIPFYVAAPGSTFDLDLDKGEDIIIEQRSQDEVKNIRGKLTIAPYQTKAFNFAFDVTPSRLITGLITDRGIIYPPYRKNIKKLIK